MQHPKKSAESFGGFGAKTRIDVAIEHSETAERNGEKKNIQQGSFIFPVDDSQVHCFEMILYKGPNCFPKNIATTQYL